MEILKREQAYQKLRDAITFGDLKPGEKLVELTICRQFDLGRTPMREALRQLQMEGYIEAYPNRGAVIRKITVEELEAVYDVLARLEGYAVEMAAQVMTPKDIKTLRMFLKGFNRAAKSKDFNQWFDLNAAFHGFFQNASGNQILKEEIGRLRNRIYRYRALAFTLTGTIDKYLGEHDEILKALVNGQPAQAREAMQKHLGSAKEILARFLRENRWI
ncbi:MAG: GntR family transcriptional regulator [Pseudomonadota bacterium]